MPDILIPERIFRKMEKVLNRLDKEEELINEDEAAKYLGVTKKTLQNLVSSKEIPASCYKKSITNRRMYIKSKLIII
jgi:predicted DNA-binding protein (UPF0251 family)